MVSSDLLKNISLILNQISPTHNSSLLDETCLKSYGPGGKQNFTQIPKVNKKLWLREKVVVPTDKETYCNEATSSEILSNLNYTKTILDSLKIREVSHLKVLG